MKRRLVFCPEINASTVVLLFEKGVGQGSWSVRDYSRAGTVTVRYADEFSASLESISASFLHTCDAPAISTADLAFWHKLTSETNDRLCISSPGVSNGGSNTDSESGNAPGDGNWAKFSVLDPELLQSLPKARKARDMKRIMQSPNSEDCVTWNAFALARRLAPETWWVHLAGLAVKENPAIVLPESWQETPAVSLWRRVPSPAAYEACSRRRMRTSAVPEWMERSGKRRPVEASSEIDISLHNAAMTVFIEAKLGSDISMRTSYDPDRNQIVRNIDCLIDEARGTAPFFWMLVRDAGQGRSYTQLTHEYRRNPELLKLALPQRDIADLERIAQRMAIILWRDFIEAFRVPPNGEANEESVYREIRTRVC